MVVTRSLLSVTRGSHALRNTIWFIISSADRPVISRIRPRIWSPTENSCRPIRLRHRQGSKEICVKCTAYGGERCATRRSIRLIKDPGIIDKNVETAIVSIDPRGSGRHALWISDVELNKRHVQSIRRQIFDRCLAALGIPSADQDERTGLRDLTRDFQSNALVGSGNQCDTLQASVHLDISINARRPGSRRRTSRP